MNWYIQRKILIDTIKQKTEQLDCLHANGTGCCAVGQNSGFCWILWAGRNNCDLLKSKEKEDGSVL